MKSTQFLPLPKAGIAFRPEYFDFDRGIRVGNLEDNERITRLLKIALEYRFRESFVTERWGRGLYWKWIGYLSRANRSAKPLSSRGSFGCAKYFIMVDTEEKLFKCGLQVERGYLRAPEQYPYCELRPDWDWHRFTSSLKRGSPMMEELARLVRQEGFRVFAGSWGAAAALFSRAQPPDSAKLRKALRAAPGNQWAGIQIYYPMRRREVHGSTGVELFESILAIFDEVTPAMNLCMQIPLSLA